MSEKGTLCILGYQKQHFKKENFYYSIFEKFFQFIKPYFECDADESDKYYINSHSLFNEKFAKFDLKTFEEKISIDLQFLICFLKSWSAYFNFMKSEKVSLKEDPIEVLKTEFLDELRRNNSGCSDEDLMKIKFDYYNFYFMINLSD